MRLLVGLFILALLGAALQFLAVDGASPSNSTNKFRDREASDDMIGYPQLDEDALLNTKCPKHIELRWQTEVSSSIYATPLIADINRIAVPDRYTSAFVFWNSGNTVISVQTESDGKLEIVVPSFVHYLQVLEGSDGDKMPGWPAFHQSTVHSSPLLYDIDKDGTREIALATYNGVVNFFRVSGYLMMDKLEVPRRKVRKNWYVGLDPDPVDRSHPDVHDDSIAKEASAKNSISPINGSMNVSNNYDSTNIVNNLSMNASKLEDKEKLDVAQTSQDNGVSSNLNDTIKKDASLENGTEKNQTQTQRRLLEEIDNKASQDGRSEDQNSSDGVQGATVENDQELEEEADSSFDLFRDTDELADEYNYDYDDYIDESMWGDENWTEESHEKAEDYVSIDSHILCTPVIADIDNDGSQEMVVAVSYFFDHEYYDNPEHSADLGGINIEKYVASGIVVFNLDTKQVKWIQDLDLSVDSGNFRAYVYSSPTVVDLDGDGKLDILVGTSYGLFYILDHHGQVRNKFPLEMAEIQAPAVAADINDDGKIEIVTVDTHGNVAAWTAQGEEIWEVHLKSLIPQSPTVGDVDGDGHTDIVIPTTSGNIYVLSGRDGSHVRPFPYQTNGRVMSRILLVDLNKQNEKSKGLTLVTTSFDGYLYLIDGTTGCPDVVDIGETSYSMVLADNVDGGHDLDLIVTTMNGNVYCFSTASLHHPLKEWRSPNQGRNNVAVRNHREGIFISHASRAFRDEEGKHFWVEMEIIDEYRVPSGIQGPYTVTTTLLVPGNYQGERRIVVNQVYDRPGRQRIKLPTVPVRTTGTVVVEMVDRNGLYFSDEFSLTFHMHYYKLLKWLTVLPMLGMFSILVLLRPQGTAPLPSFTRNRD